MTGVTGVVTERPGSKTGSLMGVELSGGFVSRARGMAGTALSDEAKDGKDEGEGEEEGKNEVEDDDGLRGLI